MNAAHIHLILNHFPVAGMIFAALVLAFAWWRQNESVTRIGYSLVIVTGLLTIPVFLSGEPAEDIIERLPGISKELIHAHEEAAEVSAWMIWATGVIAALALVLPRWKKRLPNWLLPAMLALVIACIGFVGWSNNLGGKISHQEIRGQ